MVLSNESKIKAVLNQYSSIVTTGPSTKALLVEDYDTVVRQILSVLSLNSDTPPQLNKRDVGRSRWYWLLIAKTEPLVKDGQVPIYWTKKNAEKDAETYGGTIVKVECNW